MPTRWSGILDGTGICVGPGHSSLLYLLRQLLLARMLEVENTFRYFTMYLDYTRRMYIHLAQTVLCLMDSL